MAVTPLRPILKPRTPRSTPNANQNTPPGRYLAESPSQQLANEFGRQAAKVNKDLNARLDHDAQEREEKHHAALAAAANEHDRVRQEAERFQAFMQLRVEQDRQQREQEEEEELDRRRKYTVQSQLERQVQAKQREVAEAKRLQELRTAAAEAERQAADIRAAMPTVTSIPTSARPNSATAVPVNGTSSTGNNTSENGAASGNTVSTDTTGQGVPQQGRPPQQAQTQSQQVSVINGLPPSAARVKHMRYVDLHKKLKKLRETVGNISDKELKKKTGDFRREIKKSVGQLTIDMSKNAAPYNKVRSVLVEAGSLAQPTIDVKEYVVQDFAANVDPNQSAAGLVQTYLLNIFAKAVFAQFVNEAGASPQSAEPIGTIAIRIFAANEFKWQGISLIDFLIAKFHVKCPLLFGSRGATGTGEAMTGIGAGFAALSLRDFGKSTVQNPFPPLNYWQAMACLVNTPPAQINDVHCILLKAMIENHAGKFIRFFGQPAIVALRKAVIDFPQVAPKSAATSALATLQVTLQRNLHLTL